MTIDRKAAAALLASPVEFMQESLVIPVNGPQMRGVHNFILDDDFGNAKRPDGKQTKGFYLMPGQGAGSFKAYWCPYAPSSVRSVVVGNQADLMFTATMDGCSLGVGSRTPAGERLVTHANAMSVGDAIYNELNRRGASQTAKMLITRSHQQYAQQQQVYLRHLSPHAHDASGDVPDIVDPTRYRRVSNGPEECSSTTFGVRDTELDDWAFYAQQYNPMTIPDPQIVAVFRVAGARPSPQAGNCVIM